jgi:L-rhamnose isomerase
MKKDLVVKGYEYAKEVFAEYGIDVDSKMAFADSIPVSMHSWQGDDLIGFDGVGELTGGIATTGNYPGRARTADELRADIDFVRTLIPGTTRLNLHSCHAETAGKKVDRDAYGAEHFKNWLDWAQDRKLGMDFNPTFFSHPMMDGNFSLASRDEKVRKFWIEHGKRCREIGNAFGERQKSPCVVNFWMPDGYKDVPADTQVLRKLMIESLDEIFADSSFSKDNELDAIESKLFGLGLESYTVASHEFSLGYATTRKMLYTLDAGHFHPTETISSKLSAVLQYLDEVMLHVSRGVRWDSDHVVTYDDELQNIMSEIIGNGYEKRVHIGLDYFDASINRLASWAIGMRNVRKALLKSSLMPVDLIRAKEAEGNYTQRLALQEESKYLPYSAIWDYYCLVHDIPVGNQWIEKVTEYEATNLVGRV